MELHDNQLSLLALTAVFLLVSIVVVLIRCWARLSIRNFGWDDWFMVAAGFFFVPACVAIIVGCIAGVGAKDINLTKKAAENALRAYMVFMPFYILTHVLIKISVCVALMRIATQKYILWLGYAIMTLSVVSGLVTFISVLNLCHPIEASWNLTLPGATCASTRAIIGIGYFISITSVVADFSCAVLPTAIVWKLQMNFRLKLSVAVILSLGFMASAATFVRLRFMHDFARVDDYVFGLSQLATCSIIECGLGIISGSAPALRPLFRPYLDTIVSSHTNRSRPAPVATTHQALSSRNSMRFSLGTLAPASSRRSQFSSHIMSNNQYNDDDEESQRDILRGFHGIIINTSVDLREEHLGYSLKDGPAITVENCTEGSPRDDHHSIQHV